MNPFKRATRGCWRWFCLSVWQPESAGLAQLQRQRGLQALAPLDWQATHDDPVFELAWAQQPLFFAAGTYTLRFCIHLPHRSLDRVHGNAHLYQDRGQGFGDEHDIKIPFLSGQATEVTLSWPQACALRFDPVDHTTRFQLTEFSLTHTPHDTPNVSGLHVPHETIGYSQWMAQVEPHLMAERLLPNTPPGSWVQCVDVSEFNADALRQALQQAPQPFVCLINGGEALSPATDAALAFAAAAHPQAQVIYSDHDHINARGFRCEPFFKPDWSPTLHAEADYIGPAVFIKTAWLLSVLNQTPTPPTRQLLLERVMANAPPSAIAHTPTVLMHIQAAHPESLSLPLKPNHAQAKPSGANDPNPTISLLIPTRDGLPHLRRCVESFVQHAGGVALDIVVINNQSQQAETLGYLDDLRKTLPNEHVQIRVLDYDLPFNFSAMNNMAAQLANGAYLGFVNDDIEAIDSGWAHEVVTQLQKPNVGALGGLLLYPNGNVQHAGIALGVGGLAAHIYKHFPGNFSGFFAQLQRRRNVSAVTGAALFMRKSLYQDIGGMDETLVVAYNDVDLCLHALSLGHENIVSPHIRLTHHESASRGQDTDPAKAARLAQEADRMRLKWGSALSRDPFYNENLSLDAENLSLAEVKINSGLPTVQ
jgi:GT2 family glycosyltransferase